MAGSGALHRAGRARLLRRPAVRAAARAGSSAFSSRTPRWARRAWLCLYVPLDRERVSAVVGCWLAPTSRGRGVASNAVRLLGMWGFTTLGLAGIELTCAPEHTASQRVATRCGFVRENVMRSHMAFKGGRRDTMFVQPSARAAAVASRRDHLLLTGPRTVSAVRARLGWSACLCCLVTDRPCCWN